MSFHNRVKVVLNGRSDIIKVTINGGIYYQADTFDMPGAGSMAHINATTNLQLVNTLSLTGRSYFSANTTIPLQSVVGASLYTKTLFSGYTKNSILDIQEAYALNVNQTTDFIFDSNLIQAPSILLKKNVKITQKITALLNAPIVVNTQLLSQIYSTLYGCLTPLWLIPFSALLPQYTEIVANLENIVSRLLNSSVKFTFNLDTILLSRQLVALLPVSAITTGGYHQLYVFWIAPMNGGAPIKTFINSLLLSKEFVPMAGTLGIWSRIFSQLNAYALHAISSSVWINTTLEAILHAFELVSASGIIRNYAILYGALEKYWGVVLPTNEIALFTGSQEHLEQFQISHLLASTVNIISISAFARIMWTVSLNIADTDYSIYSITQLATQAVVRLNLTLLQSYTTIQDILSVFQIAPFPVTNILWAGLNYAQLSFTDIVLFENVRAHIKTYDISIADTMQIADFLLIKLDTLNTLILGYLKFVEAIDFPITSVFTNPTYIKAVLEGIIPRIIATDEIIQQYRPTGTIATALDILISGEVYNHTEMYKVLETIWPIVMAGATSFVGYAMGLLCFDNSFILPAVSVGWHYNILDQIYAILSTKLNSISLIKCRTLDTLTFAQGTPLFSYTNVLTKIIILLSVDMSYNFEFIGRNTHTSIGTMLIDEWLYPIYIDVALTQLYIRQINTGISKGRRLFIE